MKLHNPQPRVLAETSATATVSHHPRIGLSDANTMFGTPLAAAPRIVVASDPCRAGTAALHAWAAQRQHQRWRAPLVAGSDDAPCDLLITCGLAKCPGHDHVIELAALATCPVLVVQDRRPACATNRGPVAVLVSAVDQVDSLLDTAFREAAQRGSQLVVLYQWDPPADQPSRIAETEQQKLLDSWLSDHRDPDGVVAVTAEIIPCRDVTRIADFVSGAVLLITSTGNAAVLRVATAVSAILFIPTAAH